MKIHFLEDSITIMKVYSLQEFKKELHVKKFKKTRYKIIKTNKKNKKREENITFTTR